MQRATWERAACASVVLLALAVIGAALLPEGLVRRLDWHVHLCWLQGFHDGLRHAELYPRWIDGANQGLGGPVFLYYAPLAYYLGSALIGLGLHVSAALEGVYALSMLLAATGLVAWLRPLLGSVRAIVVASLAVCTPQMSMFALHINMPASALALGLLPWIGWALERPARHDASRVAVLAMFLAGLLYSHTLTSMQVFLVLACAGAAACTRPLQRRAAVRVLLPAAALGLALASPYLLPMATGLGDVQLRHLIDAPQWRIEANLLFAGGPTAALAGEWNRLDYANALTLAVLFAAAMVGHARGVGRNNPRWLGYVAVAAACGILMTPASRGLYAMVEPLQYLQFGWRWQALLLLCTLRVAAEAVGRHHAPAEAGAAASSTAAAATGIPGSAGASGTVLFVGLLTLGGLATADTWRAARAEQARVMPDEALRHAAICRWPTLEYRPTLMGDRWDRDLQHLPGRPTTISGRAHVLSSERGRHERRYEIVADLPSRIALPVLAFPAWRVQVGDALRAAAANPADGRIVIELPAGRHRVALRWHESAAGKAGWLLAAAATLVVAGLLTRARRT